MSAWLLELESVVLDAGCVALARIWEPIDCAGIDFD